MADSDLRGIYPGVGDVGKQRLGGGAHRGRKEDKKGKLHSSTGMVDTNPEASYQKGAGLVGWWRGKRRRLPSLVLYW